MRPVPPAAARAAEPGTAAGRAPTSAEVRAARDFEAIFLRRMLASLEKTARPGAGAAVSGGSDLYSSMVVGAMADAIAAAGGVGLARMVVEAMAPHPSGPAPAQGIQASAVHPGRNSPR